MSLKIFLIEESRVIRATVMATLKPYDCVVIESGDGEGAIELAKTHKPDLVILDYALPGIDGYETLSKLRRLANLKQTPVMMLTAESDRQKIVKILQLGIKEYLMKPLDEEQLVIRIGPDVFFFTFIYF